VKPATITGIRIQDFMRISNCEISFDGQSLVVLGGANKQGKTSFTRALEAGLAGKAAEPPKVLRGDASKGRVTIFTSDDMVVDRTWTLDRGGQIKRKLIVTQRGERVTHKVETLLQSLWAAAGAVDPAAFLKLSETPAGRREQGTILRKLIPGLTWEELDREKEQVTAERRDLNKGVQDLEGLLSDLPSYDDAPAERRRIPELTAKLSRQQQHNAQERELAEAVETAEDKLEAIETCQEQLEAIATASAKIRAEDAPIGRLQQQIADLEHQLTQLRSRLAEAERSKAQAVAALNQAQRMAFQAAQTAGLAYTDGLDSELPSHKEKAEQAVTWAKAAARAFEREDEETTLAEIDGAEEHNRQVDGRAKYLDTREKLEEQREAAAQLTRRLREIQAEKDEQLAEADLPVRLGFDEWGITIDGLSIENASHAQQFEAAIEVAFLQAAHIGLVIVREDRLDKAAMAKLECRAAERGIMVIIERVTENPKECTIFVEDGTAEVVS